jgi:hypothetical protein
MRIAVRIVAAIQIAGSIVAAYLFVTRQDTWLIRGLTVLLVTAGLFGGIAAWRGRRAGYRVSLAVQALQLVNIHAPAFTWVVNTGLVLVLGVQDGQLAVTAGLGSGLQLGPSSNPVVFVGINFAAFASAIILLLATAADEQPMTRPSTA